MTNHVNGTPQPSAFAMLSAADQAELIGYSNDKLREVCARHFLNGQALNAQAGLARWALAHLMARTHRGLVDAHGRCLDMSVTIPLAETAPKLPAEFPLVHIAALGPDGQPAPPGVKPAAIVVRVEAPAQPEQKPGLIVPGGAA